MDLNEIRSTNLSGKPKEEIIEFKGINAMALRRAAEKFAKEPEVILESEMADKAQIELLQETQRETEENGLDL
ncbi:MAG: hypothetical protein IKJ36_02725 [Clostridia bacterium]|nr:hypothetical protein [Clostridia bacterium]